MYSCLLLRARINISLVICVSRVGEHILLAICVPPTGKRIPLVICVPLPGKHISLVKCVPIRWYCTIRIRTLPYISILHYTYLYFHCLYKLTFCSSGQAALGCTWTLTGVLSLMIWLAVCSIHSISSAVSFLHLSSIWERNFPSSL